MSSHVVFNACDESVKARLEAYWAKKLPRLEKLLVHYRPELREIRLTVSCHQRNAHYSRYEVGAVIQLPTGTLAAEAEGKDPHLVIDIVVDKLITEIKRHNEHVRHDYVFKRKSNRGELSAAGPQLQRARMPDAGKSFKRCCGSIFVFYATTLVASSRSCKWKANSIGARSP